MGHQIQISNLLAFHCGKARENLIWNTKDTTIGISTNFDAAQIHLFENIYLKEELQYLILEKYTNPMQDKLPRSFKMWRKDYSILSIWL